MKERLFALEREFVRVGSSLVTEALVHAIVPEDAADHSNLDRLHEVHERLTRLERLYEQAQNRFVELADEVRMGVAVMFGFDFVFANARLAEYLAMPSPESLVGLDCRTFVTESSSSDLRLLFEGSSVRTRRIELVDALGKTKWAACTRRKFENYEGQELAVVRLEGLPPHDSALTGE